MAIPYVQNEDLKHFFSWVAIPIPIPSTRVTTPFICTKCIYKAFKILNERVGKPYIKKGPVMDALLSPGMFAAEVGDWFVRHEGGQHLAVLQEVKHSSVVGPDPKFLCHRIRIHSYLLQIGRILIRDTI